MPSTWTIPAVISALLMVVGVRGTEQPADLATTAANVKTLQTEQHHYLDELHVWHDSWTRAKDSNTLLAYAIRNTQNQQLATENARVYHADVRTRLNERNSQLYQWNVALNASVQANERLIVDFVNQSHRQLSDETEYLDEQNEALLNDIGAKRALWADGQTRYSQENEPRTFGLTLARQESVHRKLSELATWEKVEATALAHRTQKEHFAGTSHQLWGEKRDLDVKNDLLETHIPTLKFQRDMQQTLKLAETYKKRSEELRHQNYLSQVPALETTRDTLLATLKRLRIDNEELRENKGALEEERATLQQDVLLSKIGEVNSLLEFNANEEQHQKMKTLYETNRAAREASEQTNAVTQNNALTAEHNAIVCEENVRELSKDNAYLQHNIAVLTEHCTGF